MRIFIASGIFHPDSGGPATYLYRLLPELQARDHDVRVLTYGDAETSGYPYPLRRVSLNQSLLKRRYEYQMAYNAERKRCDLVYINNLGLPRAGDSRLPRVLKIVGDHAWERAVNRGWIAPDEDIDAFQHRRYSPLVEWLKASRAREARRVQHVIVPSQYLQKMIIGWGVPVERVQVIYNALEVDQYAPTLSRNEARAALGLDPQQSILLTSARLTAWKGVDMLIDALAAIPDVKLLVAGEGPMLAALQAQTERLNLSGRVQFLGKVPHERLALYMRAVDYFALYSGYEGLSHTILESLYAGTPVIASARGGNPEVVSDHVNGLLVPHPNLNALIDAIRRAFASGVHAQLSANVQHGLDRFEWRTLVDQTINALTKTAKLR